MLRYDLYSIHYFKFILQVGRLLHSSIFTRYFDQVMEEGYRFRQTEIEKHIHENKCTYLQGSNNVIGLCASPIPL